MDSPTVLDRFVEAWINRDPRKFLDVPLAPLCFAHMLILRWLRSPLPWEPYKAGALHFAQAATLCRCRSWPQINAIDWETPDTNVARCAFAAFADEADLEAVRRAWLAYIGDCATWPEIVEDKPAGRKVTTPMELRIVDAVAGHFGQKPDEVFFWPAAQVVYHFHAINEGEDGSEFITEELEKRLNRRGAVHGESD